MPPAVSSRRNVARNATTPANVKTNTTVEHLAEQLATNLAISKNAKGKQKATSVLSQEEQRANSMRSVNSASQHLSTLFQSGWRHSQEKSIHKSSVLNNVLQSASKATSHLQNLRELNFCDIDIERAAMSVLAKLVALEMYEPALQIMHDAYVHICDISRGSTGSQSVEQPKINRPSNALLSIPILAKPPADKTILNLISTYLLNSIVILSYYSNPSQPSKRITFSFESFSNSLLNSSTLLKWIPLFSALPVKQLDSILTKSYSLLTKLVPSSLKHDNPGLVFRVRMYAINCLAYTSQGVIDNPDSFWGQCHKFALIYAKCEGTDSSQAESFVLTSLAEVVRIAEGRSDRSVFMSGDGFMSFCETWTSFANRSRDLKSLDRIGYLMQNSRMSAPASKEMSPKPAEIGDHQQRDRKQLAVDGMRLCNTLAQLSTLLDTNEHEVTEETASRIRECSSAIEKSAMVDILACPLSSSDKEMQRILGKMQRALEKCRRSSIKLIEISHLSCGQYIKVIHKFVEVVADAMEQALRRNPLSDYFSQALDTLFALARTTLSIPDPRTYTSSYDHLDKAVTILNVASECLQPLEISTYMRCTSGAFHNLAGTLYQAGHYGSAIPYLKESCRLGVKAAELHGKWEENNEDAWKQLEEQLWRRWQLLALCYTKIGDRRAAFCALRSCVETFPFQANSFSDRVDKDGLGTLFDTSPSLKDLVGVVDRVTHIGACDLLLSPQQISLRPIAVWEPSIRGALIEKQLDGLEAYSNKGGIAGVFSELLKDALEIYTESSMPIRSLRIYIRALSFAYYRGAEHISSLGTLDDIGVIVKKALTIEDLGHDRGLARFLAGYQAAAHLWLGLHVPRTADLTQSSLISIHIEEACRILHSEILLPVHTTNILATKVGKEAPARQPKIPRSRVKAPITPKPKGRAVNQGLQVNGLNLDTNRIQSTCVLDCPHKLVEVLQLSSHVLGIMALNFLKIRVLDTLRRISEQYIGTASDAFILASSDLGYEYLLLGKFRRAKTIFELTQTTVHNGGCSESASSALLLKFAELCALNDDIAQSLELYSKAQVIASYVRGEKQISFQELQARIVRLELAAMASNLLATIYSVKNDHSTCLKSLLNSLRLWNRAFDSLARLQPPPAAHRELDDSDPFQTSSTNDTLPLVTPQTSDEPKKVYMRKTSISGMEYRIGQGLLHTMFRLSGAYLTRGSSRESQFFAEQARGLAESLNAPAFICRATTRLEDLRMHIGQSEELNGLDQFDAHLNNGISIDMADIHRLRGDFEQRGARIEDAQHHYSAALRILEEFDQVFGKFDGEFGPRHSIGSSHGTDVLTPALLIRVLRENIWVLRDEEGEQFDELLNRFLAVPPTLQSQTEKDALLARLTLHDVYRRSRVDMFLSSIGETTVALPMGTSNSFLASLPPSFQEIMRSLENSEKLFWSQLAAHGQSGYVPDIRAAISSIALIRTFQASLGRSEPSSSVLLTGLLDAITAITLRREMLEVIHNKYPPPIPLDDLCWPSITSDGTLVYPQQRRKDNLGVSDDQDGDDDDDDDTNREDIHLREYWDSVRERYQSAILDAETLASPAAAELPPHWTVVHITVTDDKSTLFISRQRGGSRFRDHPLLFCIPLKGRREGPGEDESQQLTFEDAIREFNDIIRFSNETTKTAASIRENQAARAAWWKERGALDTRLQELLENIEFCWLGAFKTILNKNSGLSQEGIANLRIQFDGVFQQGLRLQDKKTKEKALGHNKAPSESRGPNRVTLDDALIECFSTLSPECRDEELEDLVYFILDLYQFHGVPVAIAEIDIDQVVVDLRSVLENHTAKLKSTQSGLPTRSGAFGHARSVQNSEDEHLFLVLDKNLQGLPWESIPILRGRSVSRVPCVSFLLDRLRFSRWRQERESIPMSPVVDRAIVNPRDGYYILNPSGDLTRTEERFKPWAKEMESVGWQGICGRQPSELEVLRALEQHDIVVYFGHGGAEQYVRSHKIRHLQKCAAVMLWGCSSGYLRDMGDFDRVGTPLNYMLAGCPTLVANLWDVTDRDLDTFSQGVFDELKMNAAHIRKCGKGLSSAQAKPTVEPIDDGERKTSFMTAVARSRDLCKLKYLTGAAPVVYGIPYYL